uniref:CHM2A protein n=1 Tax=Steinernema glaseri TaxID=37863 RepID=A0A1I7YID1_9BILA
MDLGAEPALQEEMNQELGNSTDDLMSKGNQTDEGMPFIFI